VKVETHKAAVMFAGSALMVLIVGAILLLALDKTVPDWFQALALADLTGLLGLLGSPRQETVRIDQPDGDPVPVRDAGYTVIQWLMILALVLAVLFLGTLLFDVEFNGR